MALYIFVFILSLSIYVLFFIYLKKNTYNLFKVNNIKNYGTIHSKIWKCPIKVNENNINYTYFSQFNEDKIYYDQFFSSPIKTNGIFLEVGALDGSYSNTLFYEKELGWRGILIEGLPSNCKRLKERKRERSEIFDVWGMGGLKENNPFYKISERTVVNVTCTNIKEIIYSTGVTHIDFFSLDVEGAEYMVLDTFDFSIIIGL